jgi:hypothetical protein
MCVVPKIRTIHGFWAEERVRARICAGVALFRCAKLGQFVARTGAERLDRAHAWLQFGVMLTLRYQAAVF